MLFKRAGGRWPVAVAISYSQLNYSCEKSTPFAADDPGHDGVRAGGGREQIDLPAGPAGERAHEMTMMLDETTTICRLPQIPRSQDKLNGVCTHWMT